MAVVKNAKLDGAELIRALAKSGTGDDKLKIARMHLSFIHRKENRVATAAEIIDVLEKAGVTDALKTWPRTPELTLEKALAFAESGAWAPKTGPDETPVEELLLSGRELPPENEKPIEEQMVEEFDPSAVKEEAPLALKRVPKPKPAKKPTEPTAV